MFAQSGIASKVALFRTFSLAIIQEICEIKRTKIARHCGQLHLKSFKSDDAVKRLQT